MTIKSCFPTLIYYDDLQAKNKKSKSPPKIIKDLLDESVLISQADDQGRQWSEDNFPNGFTSYSSMSQLHRTSSTFGKLEKLITAHVKKFTQALEYEKIDRGLQMSSCWVNLVGSGGAHGLHLHPLSVISGTLYLQCPPGSGQLRIEDPRQAQLMAAPPRKTGASFKNQQNLYFTPKSGKIILFESYVRHQVEPNLGDGTRISVSFNYS